jgi:hypothetical protein
MTNFRPYALSFLVEYLEYDRPIIEKFDCADSVNKLQAIHEWTTYYGVVRTLPITVDESAHTKQRLERAFELLMQFPEELPQDFVSIVIKYTEQLNEAYHRNAQSAASKLLWLRYKAPIIIFDDLARKALCEREQTHNLYDYSVYCKAWTKNYKEHQQTIKEASGDLINVSRFFPTGDEFEITRVINQEWFFQRVFDNFLWRDGIVA